MLRDRKTRNDEMPPPIAPHTVLAFALMALFGCSHNIRTTSVLAEASPAQIAAESHVTLYESNYTLDLPFETAQRNFLTRARECWQAPSTGLDQEPFSAATGFSRIAWRENRSPLNDHVGGRVHAVVTLRPLGAANTQVASRALGNERLVPVMREWLEGKAATCKVTAAEAAEMAARRP